MEKQTSSDGIPVADCQLDPNGRKLDGQMSSLGEPSGKSVQRQDSGCEDYEYVTGFKLAIVIASVTMVFFLVMLDLSIVATVSQASVC